MEGAFTTILSMNRLSITERAQILGMLVEGNSLRSCARMADVSVITVMKLLVDMGRACEQFHHEHVVNVRLGRLQCDEIWCFVGAKAKNVRPEQKAQGWGDTWTWTGLDADTKLCVSYLVGGRDADWAMDFMLDCAARIKGRVQVTTDGHKAYLEAVETAFGADCDYAMFQKIYGAPSDEETRRYSPARCIGCDMKVVSGDPDPRHVSTSFVERQNWTVRTNMRRYTRLSNGFSRSLRNHAASTALNYFAYNFIKIHRTLRMTPAKAAGVTGRLWDVSDLVALWEQYERRAERAA